MPIILTLDHQRLRVHLAQLETRIQENPQGYAPLQIRREKARLVVACMVIQRPWYGPAACEECSFFHGQQGLNCAIHPQGPSAEHCADWEGPPRTPEDNYALIQGRGWVVRNYAPGQGWIVRQDQLNPEDIAAAWGIRDFFL